MFSRDAGTLEEAIEYFNSHPFLFQREDYDKGHMERVMAVLTQENMEHLEKQFQLYSRGLELPTFIYLIKKLYRPEHEMSKYFFVSDLIKFFQAIDINGDGHLQWSQFTEYIIENIRVIEKPKYKNKAFEQNQIISSAYSKISNEYRLTKNYDLNCQSAIKKIIYLEESQNYYLIESQTWSIRVFDKKFEQIDTIKLDSENNKATILDFSIDKENFIVGCIFEDSLFFSNMKLKTAGNNVNQESSLKSKKLTKLQFLPHHKMWAASNKQGQIQFFSVAYTSRTTINFKCLKHLTSHQSSITDIIEIDSPMCIATSSMDGEIKLYSKQLEKYYTFEHIPEQTCSAIDENRRKGILGISYSSQFGNYLLSFGFSNYVYMYSLDVSLTKGYVGKYSEHTGPILWAKFIKSYPYVLSFDDKMNMRIWDFRKFQTIQFINCEKIFINPSRLEIIPELYEVLICEKKVTQFRAPALEKKSKQINEFHNIFDFKFCSLTNQIYVFTSNDVRVYNYFTGSLKKLFTKLYESNCETNITACEFGFKCRRFFVGDAGGFVRQFCSQTGEQLQNISPGDELNYQNKQITQILFLKEHSLLICCSADGRIMIYERNQEGEFIIVRDLRECHEQLVCASVSERYCLLATAGDNGDVVVWNLEKYVIEGVCVLDSRPIKIAFSPIHPIMIVATEDGHLNFFYVKPYQGKDRYKCFAKVSISPRPESPSAQPPKLTSFSCELIVNAYFPKNCYLTSGSKSNHHLIASIGTSNGNIIVMNLNKVLEFYRVEENHQIYVIKNCHRCQVQVMRNIVNNQRARVLRTGFSNKIAVGVWLDDFVNSVINVSEGAIENILISKESSAIFCKSADKKLRVYSFTNDYNGCINFSTFKKSFWKIPQVNFFKKLQAIDTTIYSIKLIENKKFQPEEENKVKVHLLLNEYLNGREKEQYFAWLNAKNNVGGDQKIVKAKGKKNQSKDSESEFYQIYAKLKSSIEKSLENDKNERIFWPEHKNRIRKGKDQIAESTNSEDNTLAADQYPRARTREKKRTVKMDTQRHLNSKAKSTIKLEACFELFGNRGEEPKKKPEMKKKNMLFTPLSTAKKIIMANLSVGLR